MKLNFPQTDVIGCKFLGFDGRTHDYLEKPWDSMPTEEQFIDQKQYLYRCLPGIAEDLKEGDLVVVSCRTGFQVCIVTEINCYVPADKKGKLAYALSKVNLDAYFSMVEKEKAKQRLRAEIEAKKAELEQAAIYEVLAEKNPDFAALVTQFKELGGTF